jgi:hypothetical protein
MSLLDWFRPNKVDIDAYNAWIARDQYAPRLDQQMEKLVRNALRRIHKVATNSRETSVWIGEVPKCDDDQENAGSAYSVMKATAEQLAYRLHCKGFTVAVIERGVLLGEEGDDYADELTEFVLDVSWSESATGKGD